MAVHNHHVGIFRISQQLYLPFYVQENNIEFIEHDPRASLKTIQNFVKDFTRSKGWASKCCTSQPEPLPYPLITLVKTPSGKYYPSKLESDKPLLVYKTRVIENVLQNRGFSNIEDAVNECCIVAKRDQCRPYPFIVSQINYEP